MAQFNVGDRVKCGCSACRGDDTMAGTVLRIEGDMVMLRWDNELESTWMADNLTRAAPLPLDLEAQIMVNEYRGEAA